MDNKEVRLKIEKIESLNNNISDEKRALVFNAFAIILSFVAADISIDLSTQSMDHTINALPFIFGSTFGGNIVNGYCNLFEFRNDRKNRRDIINELNDNNINIENELIKYKKDNNKKIKTRKRERS